MQTYIKRIKDAKTKDELHQISYEFLRDTNVQALSKETDLIDGLCVYKECELDGASTQELNLCIKSLKLPKKYVLQIAK